MRLAVFDRQRGVVRTRSAIHGLQQEMLEIQCLQGFGLKAALRVNEFQFIAAREIDRINNPDVRVARSLASLFNPVLYPGVGEVLRITQQELAYLVGLSRQRVNVALQTLEAAQAIRIEYGGLRVLSLDALRQAR